MEEENKHTQSLKKQISVIHLKTLALVFTPHRTLTVSSERH